MPVYRVILVFPVVIEADALEVSVDYGFLNAVQNFYHVAFPFQYNLVLINSNYCTMQKLLFFNARLHAITGKSEIIAQRIQ